MKMTDLKAEREKYNTKMADYSETLPDEEAKKQKKKKRKNKKKKKEETLAADYQDQILKDIDQVNKEQEESDDQYFDDKFQERDELYIQATKLKE
jgi:hypothetical protein